MLSILGTFGPILLAFGFQIIIEMHNFTIGNERNGTPGTNSWISTINNLSLCSQGATHKHE